MIPIVVRTELTKQRMASGHCGYKIDTKMGNWVYCGVMVDNENSITLKRS